MTLNIKIEKKLGQLLASIQQSEEFLQKSKQGLSGMPVPQDIALASLFPMEAFLIKLKEKQNRWKKLQVDIDDIKGKTKQRNSYHLHFHKRKK